MSEVEKWERHAVGYAIVSVGSFCIGLALVYVPLVFIFIGAISFGLANECRKLASAATKKSQTRSRPEEVEHE